MSDTEIIKTSLPLPVIEFEWEGYSCSLYLSMREISGLWDRIANGRDVFLSSRYLQAVEEHPPLGMSFYYAVVMSDDLLAGVVYMQLSHFNAHESLNYNRGNGSSGLGRTVKEFVAKRIDFYTLVCGNTLVTGRHAFLFDNSVSGNDQLLLIDRILDKANKHATDQGLNVRLLFIKDFFGKVFDDLPSNSQTLEYNAFTAQPNMIMQVDPDWKRFDDYMEALQSKYRVRVRRARKKLRGVVRREMTVDDLSKHRDLMHRYYREIADKASFNLFILHPEYWIGLKKYLKGDFRVIGYYEQNELIAFYSIMFNYGTVEAHFLGYESDINREKQLYLNMLLDMIEIAIEKQCGEIVFARTAMEIKSSVGAEARQMYFYLHHKQSMKNRLLPYFYDLLDPQKEWIPRNPFKSASGQ